MRYSLRFLVGLLAAGLLVAFGCSDDDGGNNVNDNNVNNNNSSDDTVYQLQDENDPNFIPDQAEVDVQGIVVTAVDNHGEYTGDLFAQEPMSGEFSGIKIFNPQLPAGTTIEDVSVGDIINVVGVKDEFALEGQDPSGRTVTEISNASIEIIGQGEPLEPELVASPQTIMSDPGGESYEGVLVMVQNVRSTGVNSYGDVTFTGGLVAGTSLMDASTFVQEGTCYSEVVGVLDYFFQYTLHPRSEDDFVVATNDSDCPEVTAEDCEDGVDNDADGFTDCDDFDCNDDPACMENDCEDGVDNDGDGFTDCEDFDCTLDPACQEDDCGDGVDNDGDGYTDCGDNDCKGDGNCAENTPTLCDNGIDENGNGLTDCDDPSCALQPAVLAAGTCTSEETGAVDCDDGVDNDGDGYTDCEDYSCEFNPDVIHGVCEDAVEDTEAECSDNTDNDGDSYEDCDDWSCQYAGVCIDVESTDAECSDGTDNDGDGFTDCEDFSCQKSTAVTVCEGNLVTCSDDIDNDGNGFVDCNDNNCRYCDCDEPSNSRVSPVCSPCECP